VSEGPDTQNRLTYAPGMVEASRDRLSKLAEQQASLRRVAMLVARGVTPSEVFAAVAEEMARCLRVDNAAVLRFENDGTVIVVSGRYEAQIPMTPIGERYPLDGDNVAAMVLATGQPARIDDHEECTGTIARRTRELGMRCTVGTPIVVGGRIWGLAVVASSAREPLPPDTEDRLRDYADLIATAIDNAATRDELQASRDNLSVLVAQQIALRRVATLVASGGGQDEVFAAVAKEMAHCLQVGNAAVLRYEDDATLTYLAGWTEPALRRTIHASDRLPLDQFSGRIFRTGRPARVNSLDDVAEAVRGRLRDRAGTLVGAPIVVYERVWGMAVVASASTDPLPPNTEDRIAEFADLVATGIAAATTREELVASRARIVAAADDARQRIERDLHDGAQQRLVSLRLELRMAEHSVPPELRSVKEQLSGIVSGLTALSTDLQEISRGIHPAILSEGGLAPALRTLARRCPIPANVDVLIEGRLPKPVEVAAYYVVAEALTNAAKYADASNVNICAEIKEANFCLSIQDDGIGGADSRKGSGLIGLNDRVEVVGGHMKVISPPGSGTSLHVNIPLTD
jgi:signal transduction histidine kinase